MENIYNRKYYQQTGSYPQIVSASGENIESFYGAKSLNISYKDKIVLDLGASWGDASELFIHEGAKLVVAVDGDEIMFGGLLKTVELFKEKIIPIFLLIENPEQIENLITTFKPNILKADIEGAEKHLFNIKNEIWKIPDEYLVETHEGYLGGNLDGLFYDKCKNNGYKILAAGHTKYAKKE